MVDRHSTNNLGENNIAIIANGICRLLNDAFVNIIPPSISGQYYTSASLIGRSNDIHRFVLNREIIRERASLIFLSKALCLMHSLALEKRVDQSSLTYHNRWFDNES